jgi:integrase
MQESGLGKEHERALAHGVLTANVQAYEAMRRRVLGNPDLPEAPEPSPAMSTSVAPAVAPKGPLLSQFVPSFVEFMTTEGGWRGQTEAQSNTTYRMFIEWCEDKPVPSYTREDTASFYDMLRKLPKLYSKDKRWAGLKLAQIVEKSAAVEVPRLTMKTVKRHFSALGRLFKRAKRLSLYQGENPAHGFEFPNKRKGGSKRIMWDGPILEKLFASPVWTGCHPFYRYRPGPEVIRDERYWLPILGLYHGNRLEEFAQLRREDIKQEDGIWHFVITDEGERQLKNEQSKRRVPIHPKVLVLDFLGYVEKTAPNDDARVFPELNPGGPDGKLGFYFTKWFTAYRRNIGVYKAGLDYHSFRHGVTTKLFAAGVSRVIVDELTGHEGQGTSQTEYYRGSPLSVLLEAISKVDWPEMRLQATSSV